jgi:ElaA protein
LNQNSVAVIFDIFIAEPRNKILMYHGCKGKNIDNLKINNSKVKWLWKEFNKLSPAQLDAMYRLRQSVFVVEQNCPYLDADGKDSEAIHLLGYCDNDLVATLRFFPSYADYNQQASIGRVCTSKSVRRDGIGRALMSQALGYADEFYPEKSIQIGAQSYLKPFYTCFGFEQVSDEYLEDDIPHILMQRL